jgi:hypothetical protein
MEPRLHVLYSSAANNTTLGADESNKPGYKYHSINMQALPLERLCLINRLAGVLANKFELQNSQWNIGLDLLW